MAGPPPAYHWSIHEDVRGFGPVTPTGSSKIASFDLLHCLIVPEAASEGWKYTFDPAAERLARLNEQGYQVVVFTSISDLQKRRGGLPEDNLRFVELFVRHHAFPIIAVVSGTLAHDRPSAAAFQIFREKMNAAVPPDGALSFHTALRLSDTGAPLSTEGDEIFAKAAGVAFERMDVFFLGQPIAQPSPATVPVSRPRLLPIILAGASPCELLLLVGPPAAGKSTFAKRWLVPEGYLYVNQDLLGSREKCIEMARDILLRGQRCVVDNTNPDRLTRRYYVAMATKARAPVRALWMNTPVPLARRLNVMRHETQCGARRLLPEDAFAKYEARFEGPSLAEEFTEIHRVDFEFCGDKELQHKYLEGCH
eukprot:GGOE01001714.1.p1 GENE.GGOE01001714.1~~GGOE01001714.1.p1  ORF type:complete len:390 (-),score=75.53 GGOE01001714.1:165-1262(-)